jgi:hypothetical protein
VFGYGVGSRWQCCIVSHEVRRMRTGMSRSVAWCIHRLTAQQPLCYWPPVVGTLVAGVREERCVCVCVWT